MIPESYPRKKPSAAVPMSRAFDQPGHELMRKFFAGHDDPSIPRVTQRKRVHSRAYAHMKFYCLGMNMDWDEALEQARIFATKMMCKYDSDPLIYEPID